MYDSGVTAKTVIESIKDEATIDLTITDPTYIRWLNQFEQQLYGSYIRSVRKAVVSEEDGVINIPCEAEQIIRIYCGEDELAKVSAEVLPLLANQNFYAIEDGKAITLYGAKKYTVYYRVLPIPKTLSTYETDTVKLPFAFMEVIYSKLRGESYKLANADNLAGKWLNDYNTQLADLIAWHEAQKGLGE